LNPDNIAYIMTTENGRQFVAELLDLCGVGALGASGNHAQDWWNIGRRSVGEDLLRIIRNIPANSEKADGLALEYLMLREHKRRKERMDDDE